MLIEKTTLSKIIGLHVRHHRQKRKTTIKDLAHESDMEYIQLSRIERGKINTTIFQIYKIATALDISVIELLLGVDDEIEFTEKINRSKSKL